MNPFLNPFIPIPFIKNYILDPGRIERLGAEKLERYQNKALRKMVFYAYTVPDEVFDKNVVTYAKSFFSIP